MDEYKSLILQNRKKERDLKNQTEPQGPAGITSKALIFVLLESRKGKRISAVIMAGNVPSLREDKTEDSSCMNLNRIPCPAYPCQGKNHNQTSQNETAKFLKKMMQQL